MRHIPSKDRLYKVLPKLRDVNNQLRHLLEDWKHESISSRDMMTEANGLLGGHGVEHLRSKNGKAEAYYVNMGDTYDATILLNISRDGVWATSWGDWVEAEEAQGNKFEVIDANRIADKLWMGGRPEPEDFATSIFDAVVLCAEEYQPELACKTVKAPFDDAQLTNKELGIAIKAARQVNALRAKGKRVLVTCYAGRNRSGLVVALALMFDGMSARSAISLVRERRKPPNGMPLTNSHFVQALKRMEKPMRAQGSR